MVGVEREAMTPARPCVLVHLIDSVDKDTLTTVAVADLRSSHRLLELTIDAAVASEGWTRTTAARLLSISVGDSVLAVPVPMTQETGERCWAECRGAFCESLMARRLA